MPAAKKTIISVDWPCFAASVRIWRTSAGLGRHDVGNLVGSCRATIGRIENGKECSVGLFFSLCDVIEFEPTFFTRRVTRE